MRAINKELEKHISQEISTLATCWKLKLKNGQVLGFTSHDKNLNIEEVLYLSNSGFNISSIESSSDLSIDNLDIQGVIDNELIKEDDLLNGKYDYAEVIIFKVNYEDLSEGKINLRKGFLGEIKVDNKKFFVEIRGLIQALNNKLCQSYSPKCRAILGDSKCQVNINKISRDGKVKYARGHHAFYDDSLEDKNGYYDNGIVTFSSGLNEGISMEVKSNNQFDVELMLPLPHEIKKGDLYKIVPGCDKDFVTCCSKFDNSINFRGEPHIPIEVMN